MLFLVVDFARLSNLTKRYVMIMSFILKANKFNEKYYQNLLEIGKIAKI